MNSNTIEVIRSAASRLDLSIAPFQSNIRDQTRRIGAVSSAEIFAAYIRSFSKGIADTSLSSFMEFCAIHWPVSASQWSQDLFVMWATSMKRDGFFLEIGGGDGFTHSNTFSLQKHLGWKGTLIEPDPSQFRVMRKARNCSGNRLLRAAISPSDEDCTMRLRKLGQRSALVGYEGDDCHLQARLSSNAIASVAGISLTAILKDTHYDYFSLDVEGAELEILLGVDWTIANKPLVITVEHNFCHDKRNSILELLRSIGYRECFADCDWLCRGDIWLTLELS